MTSFSLLSNNYIFIFFLPYNCHWYLFLLSNTVVNSIFSFLEYDSVFIVNDIWLLVVVTHGVLVQKALVNVKTLHNWDRFKIGRILMLHILIWFISKSFHDFQAAYDFSFDMLGGLADLMNNEMCVHDIKCAGISHEIQ